jgi:hypothetical protein
MIFMWSRIRGQLDHSRKAIVRLRHLFYEDFLEAIVRLSTMCSLPTDEDIQEAGAMDAGDYLITLQEKDPHAYSIFLRERKQSWNTMPRQVAHRCVDHLISVMIRTIESNTAIKKTPHGIELQEANREISASEARQFMKRRRSGMELKRCINENMRSDVINLMAKVRERLEACLRKVPIFSKLDRGQIALLRDSMTEAQYKRDAFVFEQDQVSAATSPLIGRSASLRCSNQLNSEHSRPMLCSLANASMS